MEQMQHGPAEECARALAFPVSCNTSDACCACALASLVCLVPQTPVAYLIPFVSLACLAHWCPSQLALTLNLTQSAIA